MKSSKLLRCQTCSYKQETNPYSTDGLIEWLIGFVRLHVLQQITLKLIQGAVEWHEEKRIQRPDWCPIVREIEKVNEDLNNPIFLSEGI